MIKIRNLPKTYDLEERTARFGERIIEFAKKIPRNPVTIRIIPQLVSAGTSVGANFCEADEAESPKDFKHKLGMLLRLIFNSIIRKLKGKFGH